MRWVKTTISSVWGLIGLHPVPTEAELTDRTEDIRESMLEVLGDTGAERHPVVLLQPADAVIPFGQFTADATVDVVQRVRRVIRIDAAMHENGAVDLRDYRLRA